MPWCIRRLGRIRDNSPYGESFVPSPVVIVNLIVNVIERRTSAVDYVNDYVNDYDHVGERVDCREAALIAKRSLGDDLGA